MDDTIYRQAAIEVADAIWTATGDKNVAKVWQQLKDLPSAQPIDVQEAYYKGKIDGIKECMARMKKVNEEFANE